MNRDGFRTSHTIRASITADGLVLLDVQGGLVLASNHVGARIWQLIEQQLPRTAIAHQLTQEYRVPFDRAERDVDAFVGALVRRGLVTEGSSC